MRALITGYSGFVGPHLAEHLLECGDEVHGVLFKLQADFEPPEFQREALREVATHLCDLTDAGDVEALMRRVEPEAIYHMAAQSFVPQSWKEPAKTFEANVIGTIHTLEAAHRTVPGARMVVVGSGEMYGAPDEADLPLTESSPIRPANPYAASKASQDQFAELLARAYGQKIIRVRPFNHTGPGQTPRFVCAEFARQIARIKLGLDPPPIRVGDLTAKRDFLDVRDVARAYRLALAKGEAGDVFNVASGRPRSIQSVLDRLIELSGLDLAVEKDPARYRPNDVPVIYASAAALERAARWCPEIPFDQTLEDLLGFFLDTER